MKHYQKLSWLSLVAVFTLAVSSPVLADDQVMRTYQIQGSHVHGMASLFFVLEQNQLMIELESPAMNLIGFEHAPHNEAQQLQVEQAKQQLSAGEKLFSFNGGQCQLLTADIAMAVMEHDHKEEHYNKEEHYHESEHGDHHEEAHDEHEEQKESAAEHADVAAKYLFSCQQPATLTAIDVTLFKPFPGVEELHAQWVVRSFQGGKTLNPESSRIELQ